MLLLVVGWAKYLVSIYIYIEREEFGKLKVKETQTIINIQVFLRIKLAF